MQVSYRVLHIRRIVAQSARHDRPFDERDEAACPRAFRDIRANVARVLVLADNAPDGVPGAET